MRILRNISIRRRLTYIIMSISCISVLLTSLAISIIGIYNLRGNIIDELMVSASIVGDRNAASLLFDDAEQAKINLNVFSVKQTIVQSCLYQADGTYFASYTNEKYIDSASCTLNLNRRVSIGNRIEVMQPIIKSQELVGHIYIESTLSEINRYIEKQTLIAVVVALTTLIISYFLAINLQNAIARPILSLADTAREVSIRKDYSIRARQIGDAKKDFNNELVILTHSFNDMLSEIEGRDHQLKEQNIDLEKAKNVAETANRSKSQFLANISHELRTPLNAIIGFSSILMNQLFGPLGDQKYLEYAKDINESGGHLLDIINDILDLSKAEAGRLTLNFEEVHVGKTINKCMTITAERAEKGKVKVVTDVPKMLPPLVADRIRLIQIILNVLTNAVKFTQEDGTVTLSVRVEERDGEPAQFVFTIADTGIGMSKEDMDKAFQSFGQVDSGLNRKYEGTGLGLPLTQKLMELHYGEISLESELDKGTTVTLKFPAMPPEESGYVPDL